MADLKGGKGCKYPKCWAGGGAVTVKLATTTTTSLTHPLPPRRTTKPPQEVAFTAYSHINHFLEQLGAAQKAGSFPAKGEWHLGATSGHSKKWLHINGKTVYLTGCILSLHCCHFPGSQSSSKNVPNTFEQPSSAHIPR